MKLTKFKISRLPLILQDEPLIYEMTGDVTEGHLLEEAMNILEKSKWNEDIFEEYTTAQWAGLRRFIHRLQSKGVRPANYWDGQR